MKVAPLFLIALFLASGCGQTTIYKPTEVDVPVETSCHIDIPAAPKYKFPGMKAADSITDKVKAFVSDFNAARNYAAKLEAAEEACNDRGNSEPPAGGKAPQGSH